MSRHGLKELKSFCLGNDDGIGSLWQPRRARSTNSLTYPAVFVVTRSFSLLPLFLFSSPKHAVWVGNVTTVVYISCQARVLLFALCFSSVTLAGTVFYLLLLLLILMLILLLLYAIFNASLSLMFFNCNIFAAICVCVYFYDIYERRKIMR